MLNYNPRSPGMDDLIRKDSEIGKRAAELADNPNIDVFQRPELANDAIVSRVKNEMENILQMRKELSDGIPEGIQVKDMDKFRKGLEDLAKADGVPQSVISKIVDSKGDFKKLYSEVVPEISSIVSKAVESGNLRDTDAINSLRKFREMVNENIPDIEEAKAFADFYRNVEAPMLKDGTVGKLYDLYKDTIGRSKGADINAPADGSAIGNQDWVEGAHALVKDAVIGSNPKKAEQIINVL